MFLVLLSATYIGNFLSDFQKENINVANENTFIYNDRIQRRKLRLENGAIGHKEILLIAKRLAPRPGIEPGPST